jgi:hypothetical protein
MGHVVMSCNLYLVRELREVVNGPSSETLLCPSGRHVGHSCITVELVEHGRFKVEVNARRRRSRDISS